MLKSQDLVIFRGRARGNKPVVIHKGVHEMKSTAKNKHRLLFILPFHFGGACMYVY